MSILESVSHRSETEEPAPTSYYNVVTCDERDAWRVYNFTGSFIRWAVEADSESGARKRLERRGYTIQRVCSVYMVNPDDPRIDRHLHFFCPECGAHIDKNGVCANKDNYMTPCEAA